MVKKISTWFLSVLFLPFAAVVSALFIAFMLTMLTLLLPVAALGGALLVAGSISNKLVAFLSNKPNLGSPHGVLTYNAAQDYFLTAAIITSVLQFVFTALAFIPSAVVITVVAALTTPLFFLALTGLFSYRTSAFVVTKVRDSMEAKPQEKDPVPAITYLPQPSKIPTIKRDEPIVEKKERKSLNFFSFSRCLEDYDEIPEVDIEYSDESQLDCEASSKATT